jgi:Na+/H+-dicarboxylate symporter
MGLGETIIVLLTATLSAIGAAGIPETGLVTMVMVLKAVDLPI